MGLREGQRRQIVTNHADVSVLAMCILSLVKEIIFQRLLGTRALEPAAVALEIERLLTYGIFAVPHTRDGDSAVG